MDWQRAIRCNSQVNGDGDVTRYIGKYGTDRVRKAVPVYQPLERFLNSLHLPLLTRLADAEAFVSAAETGVGVFEMEFAASAPERQQFMPIVEWIETPKIVLEPNAPSLLPFHPAISLPGRAGLRVVTKSFPAP